MRIAVFGAGGLGGYLGARLVEAGEEVAFIARGGHLRAIRAHGLTVESTQGNYVAHPAIATDDPSEVGAVDSVVVGVKAWQVPEAARAMRPMIGQDTFVVPVQNGVEATSQLAGVLGVEHVVGGTIQIVTQVLEPGHIRHVTPDANMAIGELDTSRTERVERLQRVLQNAKINCAVPPDINVAIWTKLLYIAATSGMGAVTRVPFGVWRTTAGSRQMAEDVMTEGSRVALARGIPLPDDVVPNMMAVADRFPADSTTSMQRDVAEGRPSELEFVNGSIVRLGQEVGVPTPVNAFIYHSLLPQERRARGEA